VLEKTVFVEGICGGMQIDAPFVVDATELREKRDGKYIQLAISDRTGKGTCKVWGTSTQSVEEIEEIYRGIQVGEVYQISGYAKVYNGTCEVNVNDSIFDLSNPLSRSGLDPELFVHTPVDGEEIRRGLYRMLDEIENPEISSLVVDALSSTPEFFEVPAAKRRHHAYTGGLAEHTLETVEMALALAGSVKRTDMDTDVLLAGALLHDIGKASCFRRQGFSFVALPEYTLVCRAPGVHPRRSYSARRGRPPPALRRGRPGAIQPPPPYPDGSSRPLRRGQAPDSGSLGGPLRRQRERDPPGCLRRRRWPCAGRGAAGVADAADGLSVLKGSL